MKIAVLLLPVGFAAGLLLSPGATREGAAQSISPRPSASDARLIYLRDCAYCHGNEGEGTARGSSLEGTGAASTYYMVASGRMPIDRPDETISRGPAQYSPEEIGALVDYIAGLVGGPDVPQVHPERGDIAMGAEFYLLNCSACHGAIGVGTALPSGDHAPPLRDIGAREVAATMVIGPRAMPTFVPPLTQQEMNSVVRYVLAIQEPENPGGHGLLFIGPVMEGLTSFLIGLAGLVLIARWIGKVREEGG